MNITKENFNQYVDIAAELACKGLYAEAWTIASEAYDFWSNLPESDKESENDMRPGFAVQILSSSRWRAVDDADGYAMLAENLNSTDYWSDEFIEGNQNFTGAWVAREKALAYQKLAKEWVKGELYDTYMNYAQVYIEEAGRIFEEVAKAESDEGALELSTECKIDLADIRLGVSNSLARNTAIPLFGLDLTAEQKERLMEIYTAATDVLFEDYFAKTGIAIVQSSEVENDEVKEDVLDLLLNAYSRPGDDDPYWWMFTHINEPEARKRILFVENIEDAADNDFDEVPWVFTTDRYPFDIEFDDDNAPIAGAIYEIDPVNPDKYNRIK